jgi:hypothetical protein
MDQRDGIGEARVTETHLGRLSQSCLLPGSSCAPGLSALGVALIVDPGLVCAFGVLAVLSALGLSVPLGLGLLGGAVGDLSGGGIAVGSGDVRFGILGTFLWQSSSRSLWRKEA